MKRHSLTAIVAKAQSLTPRTTNEEYSGGDEFAMFNRCCRITRAAVNEILKLQAEEEMDKLADRTKARLDMDELYEIAKPENVK